MYMYMYVCVYTYIYIYRRVFSPRSAYLVLLVLPVVLLLVVVLPVVLPVVLLVVLPVVLPVGVGFRRTKGNGRNAERRLPARSDRCCVAFCLAWAGSAVSRSCDGSFVSVLSAAKPGSWKAGNAEDDKSE